MRSRGDRSLLNIFKVAFNFGYQKWYAYTVLHNIARRQLRNEFYEIYHAKSYWQTFQNCDNFTCDIYRKN